MQAHQEFLIIANGPYENDVVQGLAPNKVIIVLDGAANNLLGIVPDYIIGDFDSITPGIIDKYKALNVQFIEAGDQDYTDLEKGIAFAKEQGASKIHICCALGGERTDHTLGNLSLLKKISDKSCRVELHSPTETIVFLQDESFSFEGRVGGICGFLGWPNATVTTSGLVWDVSEWETEVGGLISTCNQLREPQVNLIVKGSLLLIQPR